MFYTSLLLTIFICFWIIFLIVKRHWKQINAYNQPSEIKEKQIQVKKRLIENKLQKKLISFGSQAIGLSKSCFSHCGKLKNLLASILLAREQKKDAIKLGRRETGLDFNADLVEARIFLRQRKLDQAEKKLLDLLVHNPKNIEIYIGLGEVYTAKKDFSIAEETYRHILKINPRYISAYKELGYIFKMEKKWQELKDISEKALEFGCKETWLYIDIGITYKKTGYPELAEEWFKRAVEAEPQNEAFLDCLFEISIINKNRSIAYKTYNTLANISADQSKLQSYKNKLDII